MQQLGRAIRVFAVILSLLAPAMVCAVPSAQMSGSEQACCKQMHGKCGSMSMKHSCCKSTADKSDLPATPEVAPLHDTHTAAIVVLGLPIDLTVLFTQLDVHTLGSSESPPALLTTSRQTVVLRI